MNARIGGIIMVLPLLLSSCVVHKTNQAQNQPPLAPPIEDTPLPKPDNAPANLPPPVISLPDKNPPPPAQTTAPPPEPQPQPKKKKPAAGKPANPTPSQSGTGQTTDQASANPPEVPATGNFSTGDPSNLKDQTQNLITETQRGVDGINRKLSDQETKTYNQIKEFLRQARTALGANDVEGAHTLAIKAKVLLGELNQ